MINKKAQEEIAGFVLIVVIVSIIALIFLGISLRTPSNAAAQKSESIFSFMSAIRYYTTDCEQPATYYKSVGDLILGCSSGELCVDQRTQCQVLNQTIADLLSKSYAVANGSYVRGYSLKVYSGNNNSQQNLIQPITKGELRNCASQVYNEEPFTTGISTQSIIMRLDVCYNSVKGS